MRSSHQHILSMKEDHGFALVLAAVTIPVVLMLAVVLIDLGMAQVARGQLQATLDAAALSAVNSSGTVTIRPETELNAVIEERTYTFRAPNDSEADIQAVLPDENRILDTSRTELYHYETRTRCHTVTNPDGSKSRECDTYTVRVHDGWRVWVRYIDHWEERIVRFIPEINPGPANVAAADTVEANRLAWRTTFGDRFRNLRIESAELVCEDPATGQTTAFAGECPNSGLSGRYRVRYHIYRGSVEYRTMLAASILRLFQGQPPDPWVRISLADQEATLDVRQRN